MELDFDFDAHSLIDIFCGLCGHTYTFFGQLYRLDEEHGNNAPVFVKHCEGDADKEDKR